MLSAHLWHVKWFIRVTWKSQPWSLASIDLGKCPLCDFELQSWQREKNDEIIFRNLLKWYVLQIFRPASKHLKMTFSLQMTFIGETVETLVTSIRSLQNTLQVTNERKRCPKHLKNFQERVWICFALTFSLFIYSNWNTRSTMITFCSSYDYRVSIPLWSLLLMTFLLIISIVHQHFFRHQHFQITNFSWSATFFASATFVKTERVLPFQYVLSTPTKSSAHKCKT